MLKGRLWKGILAAVLVLSMLPMVALADTANATTLTSVTYEGGKVTVKGTIKSAPAEGEGAYVAAADLTILAVCSGEDAAALDPAIGAAQLQDRVVYINQFNCQEEVDKADGGVIKETGEFEFSFIPRQNATGGRFITVYAGGTDVATPAMKACATAIYSNPGPKISADTWYEGSDLVLKLTKDGTVKFPYVAEIYENLGVDAITFTTNAGEITLADTEVEEAWFDVDAATITIPAAKLPGVTSITNITFDDGGYFDASTFAGPINKVSKEVPAIEAAVTLAADNATGAVEVAVTGTFANEWAELAVAELAANETYTIAKTGTADAVKLSITPKAADLKTVFTNGTATYAFEVSKVGAFAAAKSVSVAVTTAARAKLDAASVAVEYSAEKFYKEAEIPADTSAEDKKQGWGYAYAKATDADVELSCADFGTDGELPRLDAEAKEYTVTAKVADAVYGDVTKDVKLTVAKIGELGTMVTFKLNVENTIADSANVKVNGVDAVKNTDGAITFTALITGTEEATAVVTRAGYLKRTIKFSLNAAKDAIIVNTPADYVAKATADGLVMTVKMVAGDIDNSLDVGTGDFLALRAAYFAEKGVDENYSAAADFDASGDVGTTDFLALRRNYFEEEWEYPAE
ncbi:MAG: hypothetical protein IJN59_05485 [Oscillospiraceae bacterium]|nr:hypothetical protein [Oscillospiraceae bacterium]